jgi:hypothetical protein
MRRTRFVATFILLVLIVLTEPPVFACPVCFGAADSPLIDAARLGVLVMVAVTLTVLAAFGAWFLKLRRLEGEQTEIAAIQSPLKQEPR